MTGSNVGTLGRVINGMVTSFDVGKGYGFVAEGGGRELFACADDIHCHAPNMLALGQRVRFEVFQGLIGPQVVAVRKY